MHFLRLFRCRGPSGTYRPDRFVRDYYFGDIRAIYCSKDAANLTPITLGWPIKAALAVCIAGMLFIGIYPNPLLNFANEAVKVLR